VVISEHRPNKTLRSTSESIWYFGGPTLGNEVHGLTRRLRRYLSSNLVFTQCIVLETLSRLLGIDARCKHIMQTKLTRKDVFHIVNNVLNVIMKPKAMEYMDVLQAKPNIA
jgi:hypothetical protein